MFEGLAEHFKEHIAADSKQSPWVKALNENEAKKVFNTLVNKLNSDNWKLYREAFLVVKGIQCGLVIRLDAISLKIT